MTYCKCHTLCSNFDRSFAGISGTFNRGQLEHLHKCLPDCVAYCEVSHPVFKAEVLHGSWLGPMRGVAGGPPDKIKLPNLSRLRNPIKSPDSSKTAAAYRSHQSGLLWGNTASGSGSAIDDSASDVSDRRAPVQPVAQESLVSSLPGRRLVAEGDSSHMSTQDSTCRTKISIMKQFYAVSLVACSGLSMYGGPSARMMLFDRQNTILPFCIVDAQYHKP